MLATVTIFRSVTLSDGTVIGRDELFKMAKGLIGKPVKNQQDEVIGTIVDAVVKDDCVVATMDVREGELELPGGSDE